MVSWFGCSHKKTSFPITRPAKVRQWGRTNNTYVVCLNCGFEMPYSWNDMRVLKERRRPVTEEDALLELAAQAR
ncbi:MAG TPA: hypothetical protein VIC04_08890 [Terriglobia bacterium]|jgi:hypothetical protein